jgi:hypothetical protein
MMLGMVPAALLAGAVVAWLRYHAAPAIALVLTLGVLEAGWSGNADIGTVPTALPAVDRLIAADHSQSIVVDIPFGIRGGTYIYGGAFDPDAQVLATADGHPRAVGYISRVPRPTIAGMARHAFYTRLVARQRGNTTVPPTWPPPGVTSGAWTSAGPCCGPGRTTARRSSSTCARSASTSPTRPTASWSTGAATNSQSGSWQTTTGRITRQGRPPHPSCRSRPLGL